MTAKNHNHIGCYVYNSLKLAKYKSFLSLFLFLIGIFLLPKTAYLASISPEKIIELTNQSREEQNVSQLVENPLLNLAATQKAQDILNKQAFEHNINGRRFSAWIRDVKYDYSYVGENLAIDFITSEGVISAWLASEGHRNNLLHPEYKEIGVGVATGIFHGLETIVVAQIFGTPSGASIPVEVLARNEIIRPLLPQVLGEKESNLNKNYIAGNINFMESISPYPALNAAILSLPLAIVSFYIYMFFLSRFNRNDTEYNYNKK